MMERELKEIVKFPLGAMTNRVDQNWTEQVAQLSRQLDAKK